MTYFKHNSTESTRQLESFGNRATKWLDEMPKKEKDRMLKWAEDGLKKIDKEVQNV